MEIKNIIIHGLDKKQYSKDIIPIISNSTLDNKSEIVIDFCKELKSSFKNDVKVSSAVFDDTSQFKEDIEKYNNDDNSFLDFTKNSLVKMEKELKKKPTSSGGKFVFLELSDPNRMFFIFMIRDTKGEQIKYSEDKRSFELNEVEYADTNNLAMAVRINRRIFESDEEKNYLSFTYGSSKQNEVSDYFSDWIGAKDLLKSVDYARSLKTAINLIGDVTEGDYQGSASEKLQSVITAASSEGENKVNIYNLSEMLYGENKRNLLRETLEEASLNFTQTFILNSKSKNLFKTINVKSKDIKLNFPRSPVMPNTPSVTTRMDEFGFSLAVARLSCFSRLSRSLCLNTEVSLMASCFPSTIQAWLSSS